MKKRLSFLFIFGTFLPQTQTLKKSPWHIVADDIDPNFYYGVTVANGMVGMVSSPDPLKIRRCSNGVYDYYQRGRVSNILKTFNHMNMHLEVDQRRIDRNQIEGYAQTLDMKNAELLPPLMYLKVKVKHRLMSLRTAAAGIIEITALDDVNIVPISILKLLTTFQMCVTSMLKLTVHVLIPLMSSVGLVQERKKLRLQLLLFSPKNTGMNPRLSTRIGTTICMMSLKNNWKRRDLSFALVGSTFSLFKMTLTQWSWTLNAFC